MYDFLTGPMLWVTFSVLVIGCAAKVIGYFKGLSWQLDRVAYKAHMGLGVKWAFKSIGYWLLPFGSRSWREKPVMTVLFFALHIGIIFVPLFLEAHAVVIKERLGINWPAMPTGLADGLTIAMLVAGIGIIVRRLVLPEVRFITTPQDYPRPGHHPGSLRHGPGLPAACARLRDLALGPHHRRARHAPGHPLHQALARGAVLLLARPVGDGLRHQARRAKRAEASSGKDHKPLPE